MIYTLKILIYYLFLCCSDNSNDAWQFLILRQESDVVWSCPRSVNTMTYSISITNCLLTLEVQYCNHTKKHSFAFNGTIDNYGRVGAIPRLFSPKNYPRFCHISLILRGIFFFHILASPKHHVSYILQCLTINFSTFLLYTH